LNETIPEQEAHEVPVTQNAPTQDDFWFWILLCNRI
jgi:hypothetical protein